MYLNELHAELSHPWGAITGATGKAMNFIVMGKFQPCEYCVVKKAKQSNIRKQPVEWSKVNGEKLMTLAFGSWWLQWQCMRLFFEREKYIEVECFGINKGTQKKRYAVNYIWCDNAGEILALEMVCKQEGLGIHFEYTIPSTPQQNGRVKRKFASLFGYSMLNDGRFDNFWHHRLWAEVGKTETLLENNLVMPTQTVSPFHQFFGREWTLLQAHLINWQNMLWQLQKSLRKKWNIEGSNMYGLDIQSDML